MQAFGPYPTVEKIDFSRLAAGGIFLIHGQTGAGKTSILDGICFALFGTSSGDRRSESLRCDLADLDHRTEVTLEFALGPKTYRVMRQPRQAVRKKRSASGGLTLQPPYGELMHLAPNVSDGSSNASGALSTMSNMSNISAVNATSATNWQPIAIGERKTDEAIVELLGMSESQFRQVVVLPQGQFRRFLAASSDERERLLEVLFRTDRFRLVTETLQQRADLVKVELSNDRARLEALLTQLEISTPLGIRDRVSTTQNELESLTESEGKLEALFQQASERQQVALRLSQAVQERLNVELTKRDLDQRLPEVSSLELSIQRERTARPVLEAHATLDKIKREVAELHHEIELQRENLKQCVEKLTIAQKVKDEVERESNSPDSGLDQLKIERERLRETWKNAERLKRESEIENQALQSLAVADSELASRQQSLQTKLLNQNQLKTELASLVEQSREAERLQAQLQLLSKESQEIGDELSGHAVLSQQLDLSESVKARAETELHEKNESVRTLQKSWQLATHLSAAAALAKELKVDTPCPVCGSQSHPQPAHPYAGQAPSFDDVEQARGELQKISDHFAKTLAQCARASEAKEQLLTKIRARATVNSAEGGSSEQQIFEKIKLRSDELKPLLASIAAQLTSLAKAEQSAEKKNKELGALVSLIAANESELRDQQSRREAALVSLETSRARVKDLNERVSPSNRNLDSLKTQGTQIATRIEKLEATLAASVLAAELASRAFAAAQVALASLENRLTLKLQSLAAAEKELESQLGNSGFKDLQAARGCQLSSDQVKAIESQVRGFRDQFAIAESRLAALIADIEAAPDWAQDTRARETEFLASEIDRTRTKANLIATRERFERLQSAAGRVLELSERINAAEERFKILGRLAGVASGSPQFNSARIGFQRFVLATRLDDVLEAASRRLEQMSRGQFRLKRAVTLEDKRKSGGLDLEVDDALSGTSRATASLSGGEGFVASLCLALGLADVVQTQFGGVRLETVFVDEGFGTLDPEALEMAMKTLSQLQAGGRIVGIISHVPELREQITNRLWVRKSLIGSRTSWDMLIGKAYPVSQM